MLVDIALAACAIHLLHIHTLPTFLLSQILLTLFYFHNFALLHECGHGNVHAKRWINNVIGHYASIFCFMPFFPWKLIHQQHHLYTGNIDLDPTMKALREMREKGKISLLIRVCWQRWIPMAALTQHFVFWFYPLTLWKEKKMVRETFLQSAFSVGLLAAVYIALFHFFPDTINLGNLWLSFVLYLVMTEMVNLPHHVMLPSFHTSKERNKLHPWEQNITTRSCYYAFGLSELLTLNFNLHTEHHFFPNLPWYRLRKLRHLLKPSLGDEYNEVTGIRWNLSNRSRDISDVLLPELPHPLFNVQE